MRAHLATHLKAMRKQMGLSQKQMARRLGMGQGNVARIELGQQSVTLEQVFDFYWAFGVSIRKLPGFVWGLHQAVYERRRAAGATEEEDDE